MKDLIFIPQKMILWKGDFEHSGNFALIDKEGYIRSRTDDFGNPKIYYKGVISEREQINDEGE